MGKNDWRPWVHLGDDREAMERFGKDPARNAHAGTYVWTPAADVCERDGELLFRVEVPGVARDDMDVTVQDGVLRIAGVRPFPGGEAAYHALELAYGPFERRFVLPSNADPESVCALLRDGILSVTVRRRGPLQRRIEPE